MSKKTKFAIALVIYVCLVLAVLAKNDLYDKLEFALILFPLTFIYWIFVYATLSGTFAIAEDRGFGSGTQWADKRKQKHFEREMALYEPQIKSAVRHRDFEFLIHLAKEFYKNDYWLEAEKVLEEVLKLDPNGLYGKEVAQYREGTGALYDEISRLVDPLVKLNADARKHIRLLEEKYIQDLSATNTLALAEAYRSHRMNDIAVAYYEEVLSNFKRSPEATRARDRLKELTPRKDS